MDEEEADMNVVIKNCPTETISPANLLNFWSIWASLKVAQVWSLAKMLPAVVPIAQSSIIFYPQSIDFNFKFLINNRLLLPALNILQIH